MKTRQEIISVMTDIVEATMKSMKSDFYKWDMNALLDEKTKLPLMWIVGEHHTYLLNKWDMNALLDEKTELRDAYYIESAKQNADKIYLITENGVNEITPEAVLEVVRDITCPVVYEWKEKHGPMPKNSKVKIKFQGIRLDELKLLIAECEQHGDQSLMKAFHSFRNRTQISSTHQVVLCWDKRYKEFSFIETCDDKTILNGGIVFHGWPETGYIQNNSVQIEPQYGWYLHT